MKVLTGYHSYNSKMSCWYSSIKKHRGEGINAVPVLLLLLLHSSGLSANALDAPQPLGLLCNPSTYLAQAQQSCAFYVKAQVLY
jgi:hypothetical protein